MNELFTPEPNPSGLCWCGCGQPAPIAYRTQRPFMIRGKAQRYINGHGRKLKTPAYVVEDRGYKTPCWIWQRCTNNNGGYGVTRRNGKNKLAHVAYYEDKYGPVPEGHMLDHLCRVRPCCNPDHVEPVVHATNIRRGLMAKLTMEQAEEIRLLKAEGATYSELSERFHVAECTLVKLIKGRSWV